MFCTYLTCYEGDKLPPFYIGSSSVDRVLTGYRGTVTSKRYKAIWKQELRDNPELFDTVIVQRFHTRMEALAHEYELQIRNNVVRSELFINQAVAAPGGFFGRNVSGINHPLFGTTISESTRAKIIQTGVWGRWANPDLRTADHQKYQLRTGYSCPAATPEFKAKAQATLREVNKTNIGGSWWNDGISTYRVKQGNLPNPEWCEGMAPRASNTNRTSLKNYTWWNDGQTRFKVKEGELPLPHWKPGKKIL